MHTCNTSFLSRDHIFAVVQSKIKLGNVAIDRLHVKRMFRCSRPVSRHPYSEGVVQSEVEHHHRHRSHAM